MITVLAEQPENKGLMHFLSILVVLCDKKETNVLSLDQLFAVRANMRKASMH